MGNRQHQYSGFWHSLIVVLWLLCAPTIADAQDEEDFYLFDFHSDGYLLAESVPAYRSGDKMLIDFALFVEALEFPIEQDGALWSGWFRNEDHTFLWRTDLGLVQIGDDHGERIESEEWLNAYDGVYVSVEALERWFDLTLVVDLRSQVLNIDSSKPLPFQLWRERMLAKYRYRPGQRVDADAIIPDQYHWVTMPLMDLSTQFVTQDQGDGRNHSGSASLAMGMDLLKHSLVYTGSSTRSSGGNGNNMNRLTIGRESATPETPFFGGAHGYVLGDIYQPSPNLVVASGTGRGFIIDRYPGGRSGSLGLATIAGDAPPGWEVELYRNGALMEFGTVGADGRYFFPDQEIPFGENIFVAKLFGPQGQTREDRQVYWGGGTDLAKGDYDFSISHIDFDQFLLDGEIPDAEGLAARYATNFAYSRALTDSLQLGSAYTRAGLGNRDRDGNFTDSDYLSLFGSMKLGPGVLIGEAAQQFGAGQAWNLEYLTAYKGQNITIRHGALNDYESPTTLQQAEIDMFNEVAVDGLFGGDKQYSYTFRLRQRELATGSSDLRLINRLSFRFGRWNLTNDLDHLITSGSSSTTGHLKVASRINGVAVRGQLDYMPSQSKPLRQISASMNWEISGRFNNNLTVSKRLVDDGSMFISNLLSVRVRDYDMTFSVYSDFEGRWSVGAGFNIAFGYDGQQQAFITDPVGLANTGRATMNLFIDEDNDGIRDPGEEPVSWARYRDQETLEHMPGVLPLSALPASRPVIFDMQQMELDDPFLMPRAKAYELRTHAGSDVQIDVAVVLTGDIEGHVLAGKTTGARGVIVTLHDLQGREVARTRSEFDGYYSFNSVPGGNYEVRITIPGQGQMVRPIYLDPQDGYVVLEKIYIFE